MEAECNKLPGGHLATFRNNDELDFLKQFEGKKLVQWKFHNGISSEVPVKTSQILGMTAHVQTFLWAWAAHAQTLCGAQANFPKFFGGKNPSATAKVTLMSHK